MTRPVPSASCRVHAELFVENATPADTHWAIIIPPPNQALADPSLPLYSALSLSLPLPSLPLSHPIPLLSWIARLTPHVITLSPCLGSELYSPVSYLGNASSYSRNSSNLHQIISWLPAEEITIHPHPRSLVHLLSVVFAPMPSFPKP